MSAPPNPTTKYSAEQLDGWKRSINAGPILARRMNLRRENAEWVGLCPYHTEKTASFKIYKNDDGFWLFKCHGCGKTGNVFQAVAHLDHISFPEAVTKVLEEAGTIDPAEMEAKPKPKENVTFTLAQYAQCERALEDSHAGQLWLANRGITLDTARRFHLGFIQDASAAITGDPKWKGCGEDHPWHDKGWITFPTLSLDNPPVVQAIKYRSLVAKKAVIDGETISGIIRARQTATVLYNLREVNQMEDVFVDEGEPDTIVLSETGTPAVGLPSASYKLSGTERAILEDTKRIFLAGDDDHKEGTKVMHRLWREFSEAGRPAYKIQWPDGCKDANEVLVKVCKGSTQEFQILVERLKAEAVARGEWQEPKAKPEDACADSGGSPPAAGQNPTETAPLSAIVRPPIPEAAFYGLIGAITKKLDPCTEAHPMGILIELLVAFGNLIGRCAYIQIEDTKHFTNEFMVKVGETSRARKGTGRNRVNALMQQVDPYWVLNRHISGIGSGEIVVHQIRDPRTVYEVDKKTYTTKETVIPGVADKRLLVNVGEFQGILAICHRPDTTLSVVLRNGWDSLPMANLVKTDPAKCQEPHLSLDADTTAAELSAQLSQTEKNNGFANRILWVCVWRNRELALGGPDMDWSAEVPQLREAAEFARGIHRVYLDERARKMWTRTMYPKLERDIPGVIGAVTGRASAHTLRIALIFALLDKDNYIRIAHLEAAAAVWQYCEDSVYAIFGDMVSPNQRQLLDFLAVNGDTTKTQIIRDCFGGHRTAKAIDYDLEVLKSQDRVREKIVDGVTYWNKLGKAKTVGN